MASRRARLQIKPNIGGPPAAKAAVKKPVAKSSLKQPAYKEPDVEPTKIVKPDDKLTNQSAPTVEKESVESPKKAANEEKSNNTPKYSEVDAAADSETSTGKETRDSIQTPPTRARLRRFGQVNLSTLKGSPKSDKSTEQVDESSQTVESPTPSSPTKDKTKDGDSGDTKKDTSENKPLPRRSRFPKAKPNVNDAGRKRQRTTQQTEKNDKKEKESSVPAVSSSSPAVPSIIVSPPELDENSESMDTSTSATPTTDPATDKSESVQMTEFVARPLVPRSPIKTPVSPAILSSSPMKQAHGPDRRQRTVSVTEPPVIKRAKKPKVDAPTDQPPDRSTMKMRDLIHWNPKSNPMKPKVKAPAAAAVVVEKENVAKDNSVKSAPVDLEISEDSNSSMPVPQVTIGPDGNIVINEKSLVVDNPDDAKGSDEDVIIDETDMITTYGSFKKINKSKRWTKKETAKFYKALGMIGIDFFLIQKLFPKRSRFDIKKKFKNEERKNKPLIDKILMEDIHFDPAVFEAAEEESSSDEEQTKKKKGPKDKKGAKKKVTNAKKTGEKEKVNPKKKSTKRKTKPLNYFEDSEEEDEEEEEERETSNTTADGSAGDARQPQNVTQNDGEVVDILMDMRSGRLPAEGNQTDKNTVKTITPRLTSSEQTILPGIQNIMTIKTQHMSPMEYHVQSSSPASVNSNVSAVENTNESNRVVLNSPLHSPQIGTQRSLLSDTHYTSPRQIQTETSPDRCSEQTESVEYQSSEQPIESQTALVANGNIPEDVLGTLANIPQGQEEQYVLVTVVPEGGEETMIHIYRLQDGALTQGAVTGGVAPEVENL